MASTLLTTANLQQHENIINNSEVINMNNNNNNNNSNKIDIFDGLQQPTTITANTSNVEDEKLLNMSKKLNVFRKHHREIRKLEKINEKHERQTDYDVRDEHVAKKTKENASKVSKDHRLLSLVQTCERLFNEEKKMLGHGDNFWECDQIKKQMKSWKTKTKAHARKRKNQEIAQRMYKSGNNKEARKARSQNIKADRLRKFTPFSF